MRDKDEVLSVDPLFVEDHSKLMKNLEAKILKKEITEMIVERIKNGSPSRSPQPDKSGSTKNSKKSGKKEKEGSEK